ncbi:MAG: hypothetical protein ACREJK_04215, partial [Candidatus Methylomirabilales bacterium]
MRLRLDGPAGLVPHVCREPVPPALGDGDLLLIGGSIAIDRLADRGQGGRVSAHEEASLNDVTRGRVAPND